MRKATLHITTLICLLLLQSISFASMVHARETTQDVLDKLGGYTCPNSDFTCVTLTVPLDHFAKDPKSTIDVVFGVLPATGERKGMFVTATGGPGTSGLASADSYTAAFDPAITEHYDIVFFDQRGAYQSGNLQCPDAVAVYYGSNWDATTPAGEKTLVQTAKTFAQDCIKEMAVEPATLAYYGTNQAIADLDTFRQAIGDEKIWLYGESYGTQYAQTYAATYPDHVAGLILDGTVDLTHSLTEYYTEQTQAFSNVIKDTLKACNADETCAGDFAGGDVAKVVSLAARLDGGEHLFRFGRRQNEFDVARWLFKRLQQGVEGVFGEHVDFVDDVDFEPAARRAILGVVDHVADVIHAGVGGGVDLDDVQILPLGDGFA